MKPVLSIDDLEIGRSFKLFYNKGNPNNFKYHLRGIIDNQVYVVMYWRKSKGYWEYKTLYKSDLEYYIEKEVIFK